MRTRLRRIVAAALLVAVSSAAMAGVVRDQTGNPGVQSGGHALPSQDPPRLPHSLVGAIAQLTAWPFGWFDLFGPFPLNPFFPRDRLTPVARHVTRFHGFGRFAPRHK